LVGVGRWRTDSFELAQFFLSDPAHEPAFLEALTEYLAPCEALVTFNGKGFDVPLLNTRYITNAQPSPLPALAHLDLLPLARRLWRDRLPSRALGSLEQYILGVTRTQEDVPGWMIPQIYFDYMRNGDARPLKSVFYHNAVDVLSMAALLQHVAEMLHDPLGSSGQEPLDLLGMGRLYESLGHTGTAIELYQRALGGTLPRDLACRTRQQLSLIHKRREDWPAAIALWEEAAAQGEVYACVELAKYWEHRRHDFAEAQRWTLLALSHAAASGTSHAARLRWMQELKHRQGRLRRREARQ
jgi:tetratricopeptide (TPR) repeat protein